MGIIDEITGTVKKWINGALSKAKRYAYGLYNSGWQYTSQVSSDMWKETGKIWKKVDAIPILTKTVILGWVNPLIDTAKTYAQGLVNTLESVVTDTINDVKKLIVDINGTLNEFLIDINELQDWVIDSKEWFTDQLDNAKDNVLGWVVEGFESILDKVFEEEET